jgi:hypothetical protein
LDILFLLWPATFSHLVQMLFFASPNEMPTPVCRSLFSRRLIFWLASSKPPLLHLDPVISRYCDIRFFSRVSSRLVSIAAFTQARINLRLSTAHAVQTVLIGSR